jgi:DNA-directed RNA polymerase specialized sigma24 family protein
MDSPAGYVYRTALNLFRSRLRRLAVRARHIFSAAPSDDISGAVSASQDVHRALATLPVAQREALILVEWLGLGSEEALGWTSPQSLSRTYWRASISFRAWVTAARFTE